jgi:hypothetical protein
MTPQWEKWLAEEDSPNALAPDTFDEDAALVRVKAVRDRLVSRLSGYKVQTASLGLYQDGTGLTHFRITLPTPASSSVASSTDGTLAMALLSHFGDLATIEQCSDPELLAEIRSVLEELGFKYLDYDYLASTTYNGKCRALVGSTWAQRYFSLAAEYKHGEGG